jgi:predicted amidohydrolase YtcJ
MKTAFHSRALVLVLLLTAAATQLAAAGLPTADMIFNNGKILTVDKQFSIAEAIAIKGNKILAVGTTADLQKLASPSTQWVDLKGMTMLPGINDAHSHLLKFGLSQPPLMLGLSGSASRSIATVASLLGERVRQSQPGEWIQGRGWDRDLLEELNQDPARRLNSRDLDAVSPNNPVYLIDYSAHEAWANSKALEIAGITRDTPDPQGGVIERDPATGEPTGLFKENALSLISRHIPSWSPEDLIAGAKTAMDFYSASCVTSVTDPSTSAEFFKAYEALYKQGEMTVRVNTLINANGYGVPGNIDTVKETIQLIHSLNSPNDNWLSINGIKLFADGITTSGTSWMTEPYLHGHTGALVIEGDTDQQRYKQLQSMIQYVNNAGYQLGIHATGDRAAEAVVDGMVAATKAKPQDLRHYIIHSEFISPKTAKLMHEFNIGANVQSQLKYLLADISPGIMSEQRAANEWPLRMLLDAGVHVTDSSDAPVVSPFWQQGIETAVLRESKAGNVSGPNQRISVQQAIRGYTIEGAWQDHRDDVKGSLEAGKLADFCVIDQDILSVDPHQISDIKVILTVVDGKPVYTASPDQLPLGGS